MFNGGGFEGGMGGISRQVETRHTSETTELGLPLRQSFWLVVIYSIAILTFFGDAILIGPWAGVIAVALILLRIALWVYLAYGLKWELAVVPFVILWGRFGYGLVNSVWIPLRPELPGWATVILLSLSIPVYAACYLVGYRMAFEIVDPNWTPPIMPRRPEAGVSWPNTRFGIPQVVVREVPRPVVINGNGYSETIEEEQPPSLPEWKTLGATVMSPSGIEVLVSDAVHFIRQAPKIGTSSRIWKKEASWKWEEWNAIITLLEQLGILARKGKSAPRFLVSDFSEQMRRIAKAVSG